MKINGKRLLAAAALLIVIGFAVFGVGHAGFGQNKEGYSMENQSYALSGIERIEINTDSPSVVIRPVTGDQIHMTWQADDYAELQSELADGTLSIDYRFAANWLESLLLSPLNGDDYVLEIELPDQFAGELDVRSASGSISVFSALALEDLSLRTVSGKIDVSDIDTKKSVQLRSTSGSVHADAVHAAADIVVQSVSGKTDLRKVTALGGITMKTTSGRIDGEQLSAAGSIDVDTTSGAVDVKQADSGAEFTLHSVSGTLQVTGADCVSFSAKSVSGGISFQELTAGTVTLKSTSGTVSGTINGSQAEYGVHAHSVSGKSNLQSSKENKDKSLSVDTVSGGIDVRFSESGGK